MDPCFQSKEFHSLSREVIDNKERTAEKEVPGSFQLGLPRMEEIKMVFAWGSDFRTQVQTSKAHCLTPISPLEAQETQSAKPGPSILLPNTSGKQHSPACKSKKVGSGEIGPVPSLLCSCVFFVPGNLFSWPCKITSSLSRPFFTL